MARRTIRRLASLNIGEQTNLATKQTTFTRAIPFRAGDQILEQPQDDRQADVLGNQSLWGEQFPPERVSNMSQVTVSGPLDLQQILLPLLSGLVGGVTGTVDGTVDSAYAWAFTPDMDASSRTEVDYYTFQGVERSAGGAQSVHTVEVPKAFCSQLVITIPEGGAGALVTAQATYRGGKLDDPGGNAASGLSIATPRLLVPSKLCAIGFFDTWAAAPAGAAAASVAVRGATITIPMGLEPSENLQANEDLDYTALDPVPTNATVGVSIYGDPAVNSLEREEKAHKEAGDLRFLRFSLPASRTLVDGSDSTATLRPSMEIIMALRHATDSEVARGQADGQGRQTYHLNYVAAADSAQTNGLYVAVTNGQASYP